MVASVHSVWVRWKDFKTREFSPAHGAFCFPTLSHANGIQAYRAAVSTFSSEQLSFWVELSLSVYWVAILALGTVATLWISAKFLYYLPRWTLIDVTDELEPPAPYETMITLQNAISTGETLVQKFVSPAVLQANETGALVMVQQNGQGCCKQQSSCR